MKKDLLHLAIWIGITCTIIGCCIIGASIVDTGSKIRCSPLPEGFSEAELVGTWTGGSPDQRDTLIVRTDRTYKQIIHVEFVDRSPIDYESDWQSWRLDYSADHVGYLHLDRFSFCGISPGIPCETPVGDGYDFCRDESIKMDHEGILLVLPTRATDTTINSIHLAYPMGSENSWAYHRQEP